jgi:hypothetical protein
MNDPTRRELRQEKREVKKAGGKRVRRELKRLLAEDPDEAPHAPIDFGRLSSTRYNGMDRDATRRRRGEPGAGGEDS